MEIRFKNQKQGRRRTAAAKKSTPWHFTLKLLILFLEALGRSSEEFYVYVPLAIDPRSRETPLDLN